MHRSHCGGYNARYSASIAILRRDDRAVSPNRKKLRLEKTKSNINDIILKEDNGDFSFLDIIRTK